MLKWFWTIFSLGALGFLTSFCYPLFIFHRQWQTSVWKDTLKSSCTYTCSCEVKIVGLSLQIISTSQHDIICERRLLFGMVWSMYKVLHRRHWHYPRSWTVLLILTRLRKCYYQRSERLGSCQKPRRKTTLASRVPQHELYFKAQ